MRKSSSESGRMEPPPARVIAAIALQILLIVLVTLAAAAYIRNWYSIPGPGEEASNESEKYRNETVLSDYYNHYPLDVKERDVLVIEFEVTEGGPVDVYILKEDVRTGEYDDLEYFSTVFIWQSRDELSENVEFQEDGDYVLVVDNLDNGRSDDAEPLGTVSYDLEYEVEDWNAFRKMIRHPAFPFLLVMLVVGIIIMDITRRKARKGAEENVHTDSYRERGIYSWGLPGQTTLTEREIGPDPDESKDNECAYCGMKNKQDGNGVCGICGHK